MVQFKIQVSTTLSLTGPHSADWKNNTLLIDEQVQLTLQRLAFRLAGHVWSALEMVDYLIPDPH